MKKLLLIMLAICTLIGCSKDNGDETPKNIEITGGETTQEVFADNTQGKDGVKFTTTGAWNSSIVSTTKADAPDWVSIDPASGDKAGDYTINIILAPNYTGENRKAEIKISCGGTVITITVEQKGVTENNEKPKAPKLVSKVTLFPDGLETDSRTSTFTYYPDNRIKTIVRNGENESGRPTSYTYTYAGNTVTEQSSENQTIIYTLNNDGYIVSSSQNSGNRSEQLTYDNGYLTKYLSTWDIGSDETKYTWKDGNLKSWIYKDLKTGKDGVLFTYEYGNIENSHSGNLDLTKLIIEDADFWSLDYFGKRTKNLMVKETSSGDEWGKDNGIATYRYEQDKDGYVTKIYMIYQKEGEVVEPECLYYEIQYK